LERLAALAAAGGVEAGSPGLADGWRAWLGSGAWDSAFIAKLLKAVGDWDRGVISRSEFEDEITALWGDWLRRIG
jgi:hypothetical protein